MLLGGAVLQDIAHDEGQVFLRDKFLLVAQLDDAFRDALCLLGRKLKSQLFKVAKDVRLAGVLTQGILAGGMAMPL